MHQVSTKYMEILQGRYTVGTALQVASARPAALMQDNELMAQNTPGRPELGPVYREDFVESIETAANVFSGGTPEIGAVIARTITVKMRKPEQTIPTAAKLVPYSRIINEVDESEWVPKGEFFIDMREFEPGYQDVDGNETEFLQVEGYDALMKAEADYPEPLTAWPVDWPIAAGIPLPVWPNALDISVLAEIAVFLGVTIEPETLAAINRGHTIPTKDDFCCREILSQIATAYAGSITLDDLGRLKLIRLNAAMSRATVNIQDDADSFLFGQPLQPFSRVVLKTGDEDITYIAGDESGWTLEAEIEWQSKPKEEMEALAASILADVAGYSYQPMTATNAVIDPAVELGDPLTVAGVTSRMYAQNLTFGDAISSTIRAPADNEGQHEFTFHKKQQRKTTRQIGGLSRAMNAISEIDPTTGDRVVAKKSLTAVFEEDGTFKSADLTLSVIEHVNEDGTKEYRTMADLAADAIFLEGKVDVLGFLSVEGDGSGIYSSGSISSKTRVYTPALTVTDGEILMGVGGTEESPYFGKLKLIGGNSVNFNTSVDFATTLDGDSITFTNRGHKYQEETITSYNPETGEYKNRTTLGYKQGASPVASD